MRQITSVKSSSGKQLASVGDERIGRCILWLCSRGKHGEQIDTYKDLNEEEKIAAFYKYFEEHVIEELSKYP